MVSAGSITEANKTASISVMYVTHFSLGFPASKLRFRRSSDFIASLSALVIPFLAHSFFTILFLCGECVKFYYTTSISGLAKNTTYQIRIKAYKMSGTTTLYSGYTTISGKTTN